MCIFFLRRALLGLLLVVTAGCTDEQQLREIQATELRFPGGRMSLPGTGPWRVLDSPGMQAATRRLSPTHTIVAGEQYKTAISNLEAAVMMGAARKFVNWALEDVKAGFTQGRYKSVSFDSSPSTLENAECNDYKVDATDHKFPGDEGRAYPYRAVGRVCVFKHRPLELKIEYSERRGISEQPLPTFEAEAADFLAGLVVTAPPPRTVDPGAKYNMMMSCVVVENGRRFSISVFGMKSRDRTCRASCSYTDKGQDGVLACSGTIPARARHMVFCTKYGRQSNFVYTGKATMVCD